MGRGGGAFFVGLALLVIGVGATAFSYMHTAPGGTYVIFTGMIVGGLIRMVTSLLRGSRAPAYSRSREKGRANIRKPAWYEDTSAQYVEKLADVPSGYCWQCGSKLRSGRRLCMACGAAQNSVAPERESTATPGGTTFGPPPKLANAVHPYDSTNEAGAADAPPPPQPRSYFPADPDGSYGWGPAYTSADERNSRSNPGYAPTGRGQRPDDARHSVAPPEERGALQVGRANGEQRRYSGELPPNPRRQSGELPPHPKRYSGELPPNPRGRPPSADDDEQPPRHRATRSQGAGWDDDEDESGDRYRSAPRHAQRPRASRSYDDGGWDDDGDSSSSRYPSRR